ncbi:MAG: hypothetical protein ACSLFO_07070 [Acidimicrobiales bacterium]
MATQRSSFAKRERDRAKKAKQALKREARLEKPADDEDGEVEETVETVQSNESAEVIMEKLAKLHAAFDDDQIEFEDFEEQKAELMARMPIE